MLLIGQTGWWTHGAAHRDDVPVAVRWRYLETPRPFGLAHRGAHGGDVPENTMAAFAAAVALGFDYLETDVHATADGVLVAFHDSTLDRVTDRRGPVARLPYTRVRQALVGGREPIPLLADVLGAWPHVRVNIDVKSDAAVGPLLDVLRRTRAHHRVSIGSFSGSRTRHLRSVLPPGTATALAPAEVATLRLSTRVRAAVRWLPPDVPCVQVPVQHRGVTVVDEAFVALAHEQGRQVHVWTVNDETEMQRLLDLGVDALVTDEAARLSRVLAQRASR